MSSPVRWVVIVVFVAVGVLILSKGFGSSSGAATPGITTPHSSPTPSHTPTHKPTSSAPSLVDITVAVFNGANSPGLASSERQRLATAGWDVISIGNAPAATTTTIYYLTGAQVQANYMKAQFYPHAQVQAAPSTYHTAKITVILGTDFVATP